MRERGPQRVGAVLTRHIEAGTTPGGMGALVTPNGRAVSWVAGNHGYGDDDGRVRFDDLYDLASVTKVVATATLCACLVDGGRLDLDEPVSDTIPEVTADGRVTARALLSHCAGFPAHVHLYKRMIDREEVIRAVCTMDLEYEPHTQSVYSDMGYILLGELLERATGQPLNELFRDYVREPLGLHETVYAPGPSARDRIVPTELDQQWRGRLVHGEVHDENASVMRGVAPHAGLFATLKDVSSFAQLWLNEGFCRGKQFLSASTVRRFRSPSSIVDGSTWGLGWDTVSPGGSTSGVHFSSESYGILGFTGTSIWVDPIDRLAIVLLTNRVHPTRENWGIKRLRPEFHDAVRENVKTDDVKMGD